MWSNERSGYRCLSLVVAGCWIFAATWYTEPLAQTGPGWRRPGTIDPRCSERTSCQLFECVPPNSTRSGGWSPYCRSPGMGDAVTECGRMGGSWRHGPGGAPFIWCDFPQPSESTGGANTGTAERVPETPRQSRAERMERLAGIVGLGLELVEMYQQSVNEAADLQRRIDQTMEDARRRDQATRRQEQGALADLAKDFALDRDRTVQDMLGDLSEARRYCGGAPGTRQELSQCFRSLSAAYIRQAALCEDSSQDLSTLGRQARRPGVPDNPSPSIGQRTYFDACTDLKARGAKAANCVAIGILQPGTQFNPLFRECVQKEGLI
jgi:hypothetical protein